MRSPKLLQLFQGSPVKIKSTTTTSKLMSFEGFSNGTGSLAACPQTGICSATINQNSELTANLKKLPPQLPPDSQEVLVRKLGSGFGSVTLTAADGKVATSSGPRTPQEKIIVKRGTTMTLKVTPNQFNSKLKSIVVTGDPNAQSCNGKANCTFNLSGNVTVEATLDRQ